jgi:hypothetical protein
LEDPTWWSCRRIQARCFGKKILEEKWKFATIESLEFSILGIFEKYNSLETYIKMTCLFFC